MIFDDNSGLDIKVSELTSLQTQVIGFLNK